MAALRPFVIKVIEFQTEAGFDKLTVKAVDYSGNAGPNNVKMAVGDEVVWASDFAENQEGWKICAEAVGNTTTAMRTSTTTVTTTITTTTTTTKPCDVDCTNTRDDDCVLQDVMITPCKR